MVSSGTAARSAQRPALAWAVLALTTPILALLVATPGPAGAGVGPVLRLASVDTAGDPDLVVVAPATLANAAIPASAFQVRQAGRILRISATRVIDDGLDVIVVLDDSASNPSLALEQSVASDLLRNLPPEVRTATVTSGGLVHAPQPGRTAALQDLAQVKPDPAATAFELSSTLTSIAATPTAGRTRVVVLLTACRAELARGFPTLSRGLGRGRQQLDVVATGDGCGPALAAQARDSGGVGVTGVSQERVAESVDTVTYDILGQYRVSVHDVRSSAPLAVSLDYQGTQATTSVPLPAASRAPASAPRPVTRALAPKVLAGVSGLLLVATAAGYLLAYRRRSRPVTA